MNIDFFEYEGKKYTRYTKLIIHDIYNNNKEEIAYFISIYNNTVRLLYSSNWNKAYYAYSIKDFYKNIIQICNENGTEDLGIEVITKKDKEIDKLFYGWMWYIALMLLSCIFTGFVIIWIIISVVFFKWRKKVKKEETYYVKR